MISATVSGPVVAVHLVCRRPPAESGPTPGPPRQDRFDEHPGAGGSGGGLLGSPVSTVGWDAPNPPRTVPATSVGPSRSPSAPCPEAPSPQPRTRRRLTAASRRALPCAAGAGRLSAHTSPPTAPHAAAAPPGSPPSAPAAGQLASSARKPRAIAPTITTGPGGGAVRPVTGPLICIRKVLTPAPGNAPACQGNVAPCSAYVGWSRFLAVIAVRMRRARRSGV